MRLGLASVTSERRRLTDVLSQKLSQLELAAPVSQHGVGLGSPAAAVGRLARCLRRQGGAGGGRDTAPQLVERLRARSGEEAVYGVRPVAEHRPEAAWQRVQELRLDAVLRAGGAIDGPAATRPRPVWLLDEPAQLPLGSAAVAGRAGLLEEGPERIESGWWDGKGIARDYYIVRRTGGARLWVFQERQSKRWYVHGVFA